MGMPETTSYETVLDTVRQWPVDWRFTLVQEILSTLSPRVTVPQPRRRTLERALGLLTTSRPTPPDAEIRTWLDERRTNRLR